MDFEIEVLRCRLGTFDWIQSQIDRHSPSTTDICTFGYFQK